ncbi:MAG: DUF1320 domain-containing protein [Polaromonas sp.]|nr:DUF1320 domain-containing protein [Polaromonas sp.]
MTYATQTDMVDRFGFEEVAQRTNRVDGLTIDTVVLGRALLDADAEINGYLATRYALPLASTPAVLVRLAADMARYMLCGGGVPDSVGQRYKDAVSLLKRMASGEVQLADVLPVPAAGGSGNAVACRAPSRVFGADQLQGY